MEREGIIKKIWRVLYVPFLYLLISSVVEFFAMIGYSVFLGIKGGVEGNTDVMAVSEEFVRWVSENAVMITVVAGLVTLPILILLIKGDKNRLIREHRDVKFEKPDLWKFLLIVPLGACACVGFNILITVTGIVNWGGGFEDTAEVLYGGSMFGIILGIIFVIPAVEELVFRGVVFSRIRDYTGVIPAIILSALYFGIYHMNLPQGIYAFCLGILMAWVFNRYKTIWASIIFHVSANAISVVLTFTPFLESLTDMQCVLLCAVSLIITAVMVFAIAKLVRLHEIEEKYDTIVVGAGFAGAVAARELAQRGGEKVLILEKRYHIGGNCYDSYDSHNILVHNYGPHIFHTDSKRVYDYLSQYTEWNNYSHEVGANINGKIVPVPFNINTLYEVFPKAEADVIKDKLFEKYGEGNRVPILELMSAEDDDIKKVGEFVYENIFFKYTMKQWGKKPEEIDSSVTARVPVVLSEDNRYFQDEWQGMPKEGYTAIFNKMLKHDNIKVLLNADAKEYISLKDGTVYFKGKPFKGRVIFTGPIDEFFDARFGRLPYRSLRFEWKYFECDSYQPKAVINYTVSEDYTRITEFKKLTGQNAAGTTVMREYPMPYESSERQTPYYAVLNSDNQALYEKYKSLLNEYPDFYLLGRLAEYKYYNIDGIVDKALQLADSLVGIK